MINSEASLLTSAPAKGVKTTGQDHASVREKKVAAFAALIQGPAPASRAESAPLERIEQTIVELKHLGIKAAQLKTGGVANKHDLAKWKRKGRLEQPDPASEIASELVSILAGLANISAANNIKSSVQDRGNSLNSLIAKDESGAGKSPGISLLDKLRTVLAFADKKGFVRPNGHSGQNSVRYLPASTLTHSPIEAISEVIEEMGKTLEFFAKDVAGDKVHAPFLQYGKMLGAVGANQEKALSSVIGSFQDTLPRKMP